MTTDSRLPFSAARAVIVAVSVVLALLVGFLGLLTGVAYDRSSPPRVDANQSSGDQEVAGAADGLAVRLALVRAQQALDRRAERILAGPRGRLAQVPFRSYSLQIGASADPSPAQVAHGRFRTSAVVRYRLPVDRVQVRRVVDVTFRRGDHGWRIARLGSDRRDLWTHERVQVARDGRSLVVGSASLAEGLPGLVTEVEDARTEVADFWSASWPAKVVAVLPGRARTMNPLVDGGSVSRLPAVTHWVDGASGPVVRVILNPDVFLALPTIGQQIVLRHEITHVAQDTMGAEGAPTWLTEGLAEYVGYRGTGLPDSIVGSGALESVRDNGAPRVLPAEAAFAFDLSSAKRTKAYEYGWAACRMIADRYGEHSLIPFYRATLNAAGDADARIHRAARGVLGISGQKFVVQWQSWLSDHA